MNVRKEPLVFALTVAVVGFLSWRQFFRAETPLRQGKGEAPVLERHPAPEVARSLAAPDARRIQRDPFSPPSNTRPLPPLELVEPPRRPLPVLRPPPWPAPAPRLYARLLAELPSVKPVDGLFAAAGEEDAEQRAASELLAQFGALKEQEKSAQDPKAAVLAAPGSKQPEPETADERAARLDSYRQLYDWIQLDEYDYLFGSIENKDRFALGSLERASEPVLLREVDPSSGRARFPGLAPVAYERARVRSYAFARTASNLIEQRRHELGPKLSRSSYSAAMRLAEDCIAARLDAPRALAMAEELYLALAAIDPQDPLPRLGLGRCLEAGYQFDRAFTTYEDLIRQFDHRAIVHLRMAGLLERFLLFDRARAEYETALARERGSCEVHWQYGRFLLARGEDAEARAHLEQASRFAPDDPDRKRERVEIRCDYGSALVRQGELEAARGVFAQALEADRTNQLALAGNVACALLAQADAAAALKPWADAGISGASWLLGGASAGAGLSDVGFELLLAGGLLDLRSGAFASARDRWLRAAKADPLRAGAAWRALSYLAEVTGAPEEAYRFADMAADADPTDAWALIQRGRLARARGDLETAESSLRAALASEVDLETALLELGDLCYAQGRYAECDRYLEQALELEPKRTQAHVLRGLAALHVGELAAARAAFDKALELDPAEPSARGGIAWCVYRGGNSKEALIQLRALDDRRRAEPESDAWRQWALAQLARISDHIEKTLMVDDFERSVLKNAWTADEGAGPVVSMLDGTVKVEGAFKEKGSVRVFQSVKSATQFVSIELDVRVAEGTQARAGLFVAREKERARATEVQTEARVSRHPDGQLQVRVVRSGELDAPESDVVGMNFPAGKWVRLRLEMAGDSAQPMINVLVDGVPVRERIPMPGFGTNTELRIGLFVAGEIGRTALVQMDNCAIVYRSGK